MGTIKDQLQAVIYQKDGEDHINLSRNGNTDLGARLSPEWRSRFNFPGLGTFLSPKSFVMWLVTGDQDHRYEHSGQRVPGLDMQEYQKLSLLGKYFQLCRMRTTLIENSQALTVPWLMYKTLDSGVRQYDYWSNYPTVVSHMVRHILEKNVDTPFDWEKHCPEVVEILNYFLRENQLKFGLPSDFEFFTQESLVLRPYIPRSENKQASRQPRRHFTPEEAMVYAAEKQTAGQSFEPPKIALNIPVDQSQEEEKVSQLEQNSVTYEVVTEDNKEVSVLDEKTEEHF